MLHHKTAAPAQAVFSCISISKKRVEFGIHLLFPEQAFADWWCPCRGQTIAFRMQNGHKMQLALTYSLPVGATLKCHHICHMLPKPGAATMPKVTRPIQSDSNSNDRNVTRSSIPRQLQRWEDLTTLQSSLVRTTAARKVVMAAKFHHSQLQNPNKQYRRKIMPQEFRHEL